MNIQELLNINDIKERDQQLRRSFNPYTPLIEVANHELTALCILLNLTQAKSEVEDLCDIEQAKAVLSNQMVIGKCLDNCQWFHTHNLKYPEPKVSRQRLIAPSPPIVGSVITSANCPIEYGWAFNASQIRYSQLFAASFLWNGAVVCLGQILIAGQSCWQELFVSLGISKSDLANIGEKLTAAMPQSVFPDEVSPFSVQIRVPYQGKYCAVTPVVSHSLQCQLQRLIFDGKGRSTTIVHRNPPNISQLASALGGHVRVLKYLPPARYSSNSDFNQSRIAKLMKNRSLFNKRAIKHKDFNDSLRVIANIDLGLTLKQRRLKRVAALRIIRRHLSNWLAPILEWREHVKSGKIDVSGVDDSSIESRLLKTNQNSLHSLASALSIHFHNQLQDSFYGRTFAYHQEIMQPIKSQLNWILKQLSMSEPQTQVDEQTVYLYLSGLKVTDAQALANPYMVGVPSVFALFGLSHAFELGIRKRFASDIKITGIAWFINHYSLSKGIISPEPSKLQQIRKVSNVGSPGLIDTKICDFEMELIFRVKISNKQDYELVKNKQRILSAFPWRFAGGAIHPPSLHQETKWFNVFIEPSSLFKELSRLPRSGCWIFESSKQNNSLEDLISACEADQRLKPATLGYSMLEPPYDREGSIAQRHCYAEPALGLVECLNPIDIRLAGLNNFLKNAFWQLYTDKFTALMKAAPNWENHHEIM